MSFLCPICKNKICGTGNYCYYCGYDLRYIQDETKVCKELTPAKIHAIEDFRLFDADQFQGIVDNLTISLPEKKLIYYNSDGTIKQTGIKDLSEGNFGITYITNDKLLVIKKKKKDDPRIKVDEYNLDSETSKKIKSCRHIIPFYKKDGLDNIIFMPAADGSLLDLMGKLTKNQKIKILLVIGEAIKCLNKNGLNYFDIHPDNFLYKCHGNYMEIWVADIGSITQIWNLGNFRIRNIFSLRDIQKLFQNELYDSQIKALETELLRLRVSSEKPIEHYQNFVGINLYYLYGFPSGPLIKDKLMFPKFYTYFLMMMFIMLDAKNEEDLKNNYKKYMSPKRQLNVKLKLYAGLPSALNPLDIFHKVNKPFFTKPWNSKIINTILGNYFSDDRETMPNDESIVENLKNDPYNFIREKFKINFPPFEVFLEELKKEITY